jgi:hypothetical protein
MGNAGSRPIDISDAGKRKNNYDAFKKRTQNPAAMVVDIRNLSSAI